MYSCNVCFAENKNLLSANDCRISAKLTTANWCNGSFWYTYDVTRSRLPFNSHACKSTSMWLTKSVAQFCNMNKMKVHTAWAH